MKTFANINGSDFMGFIGFYGISTVFYGISWDFMEFQGIS
jgi:hypothetical protein